MTTQIKNVDKSFDSFQALYQINLDIKEGEFVAILGPSGCGKTTLLRLLAGFDSPSSGEVWMNHKVIANSTTFLPPEKRNIGMVFQSFALWPHMKVRLFCWESELNKRKMGRCNLLSFSSTFY